MIGLEPMNFCEKLPDVRYVHMRLDPGSWNFVAHADANVNEYAEV